MNHYSVRLLFLVLALAVSACSHAASSHHGAMSFDQGSISFRHDSVVIKAKGQEEARVAADGTLSIGGSEVPLDAPARLALARYHAQGSAFVDQAVNLGLNSAGFAFHTIGEVFKGLFDGDADRAGEQAEQGGHAIEVQAQALCGQLDQWRQAQDAAAAAVPQFRPYAVIAPKDSLDCFVDDHHAGHHGSHDGNGDWQDAPHAAPAPQRNAPGVST